ncbi:hypothetical protein R2R35_19735 [Anaerocolumna sp. AGMB13020]|uniref:hypothetical protein n=1 Tax=Anaerocolumna sp. AGMB13020 TaxID=3081750 RepID=UPI002953DC5B|nr:hypothetical protein [Anaerocolumna sp. AGMB13020]WOO36004.1 hypothetical protein R2R35_19735 [Anaerocolumna sp. AGMB13020]
MSEKRKRKKKKYEVNRLSKIMRSLKRKNKKNENRCGQRRELEYCIDVINFLKKINFGNSIFQKRIKGNKANIKIPTIFAFSENPEVVIEKFGEILRAGTNLNINELSFDHLACKKLGLLQVL